MGLNVMNHGNFPQRNTYKCNGYAQNFQSMRIAVTKDTGKYDRNDIPLFEN